MRSRSGTAPSEGTAMPLGKPISVITQLIGGITARRSEGTGRLSQHANAGERTGSTGFREEPRSRDPNFPGFLAPPGKRV